MAPITKANANNAMLAYFHRDGLLDIFAGASVLMIGLFWIVDMPWLAGAVIAPLVPAWQSARARIVLRRLGLAGEPAAQGSRAVLLIGVVSGVLLLIVAGTAVLFLAGGGLAPAARSWLGEHLMLLLAGLFALMLPVVAAVMRIGRYYLYAALTAAILLACQMWNAPIPLYWIVPGLLLMLGGGLLLFQFVRGHPQA